MTEVLAPVLYLPHGGGPLPLLGEKGHESLVVFLKAIASRLGAPSAILVVSAHWEEAQTTITSGANPELIYDYNGFPPEAYEIQYAVPGDPQLAQQTIEMLQASGLDARLDADRGFDHGLFVPLKLMYPRAQVPCVQLSLCGNLDAASHVAIGKAIAGLRRENVLIVGSGLSFHNMKAFMSPDVSRRGDGDAFDDWLIEVCAGSGLSQQEREQRLIEWEAAPGARFSHPREEHLLPLHVCFGAAIAETAVAQVVYNEELMGYKATGLLWE